LKLFKADKYPAHLVESKIKAYKPIIIQEVLNTYGAIIWIEPPNIFIHNKIDKYLNKSKQYGILAWPNREPVSQLTHPNMFKYFQTKSNEFYFVHMLDTTQFIIFNNQNIHNNLMLPWVKCALKEECIAPRGSKYYGCDFKRKPKFLYSGCHRYEKSAFSILTSLLYDFDQTKFTMWHEQQQQQQQITKSKISNSSLKASSLSNNNNNNNNYDESINDIYSYNINNDNNDDDNVNDSDDDDDYDSFISKYYESSFMTIITATTKSITNEQKQTNIIN
jgi:hypothetical protein